MSKTLSTSHARNGAKVDFVLTGFGVLASQKNVSHHRELTASTESVSINGANDWLLIFEILSHQASMSVW